MSTRRIPGRRGQGFPRPRGELRARSLGRRSSASAVREADPSRSRQVWQPILRGYAHIRCPGTPRPGGGRSVVTKTNHPRPRLGGARSQAWRRERRRAPLSDCHLCVATSRAHPARVRSKRSWPLETAQEQIERIGLVKRQRQRRNECRTRTGRANVRPTRQRQGAGPARVSAGARLLQPCPLARVRLASKCGFAFEEPTREERL